MRLTCVGMRAIAPAWAHPSRHVRLHRHRRQRRHGWRDGHGGRSDAEVPRANGALHPLGFLARRKGYNFVVWFFAGIIGLIALAFLPFATTERQKRIGNWVGAGAILASILVIVILVSVER